MKLYIYEDKGKEYLVFAVDEANANYYLKNHLNERDILVDLSCVREYEVRRGHVYQNDIYFPEEVE